MKNLTVWAILCASFALAANAQEASLDTAPGIYVDVDEVVATGKVEPVDGIISAGQPDEAALRVFAESGFTTVVDMRGPSEDRGIDDERAVVEALGMQYIPLPVTNQGQISFDTAKQLDGILQSIDGPVLLHCGSGNRVGAVLALRRSLSGASTEESVAHGKDAGLTRLESVVRKRLAE